jgi:hypothetical protein
MTLGLIDPSKAGVRSLPQDERDLAIAASWRHLLVFDNLSRVSTDQSDALCRLSSGGGFATRELYTNSEGHSFDAMRPIVLNGISEIAVRSDLRDRAFVLDLPPIDDRARRDEDTLWAEFEAVRPRILGALYDAVSCALRELGEAVLPDGAPRMMDVARWVSAAEPALGWKPGTFVATYTAHRDSRARRAVEHDVFASAVVELVEEASYELTPSAFLSAVRDIVGPEAARPPQMPQGARQFRGFLDRAAPDLLRVGVEVKTVPRRSASADFSREARGIRY